MQVACNGVDFELNESTDFFQELVVKSGVSAMIQLFMLRSDDHQTARSSLFSLRYCLNEKIKSFTNSKEILPKVNESSKVTLRWCLVTHQNHTAHRMFHKTVLADFRNLRDYRKKNPA